MKYTGQTDQKRPGADQSAVTLYNLGIDYDFIPSYDIKMIAGRNFSQQFGTDQRAVILNENAAKLLGFKDAASAINQTLLRGGSDSVTIIGVTSNFHQLGLQKTIDPMIIVLRPNAGRFYSVKIEPRKHSKQFASLQNIVEQVFSKGPF